MQSMKVLVFGTFDGLHEGHRAMLCQARLIDHQGSDSTHYELPASPETSQGGSTKHYLVVAITPDHLAQELKGHQPRKSSAERIQALKDARLADEVILSDSQSHSWAILKRVKPNIIALGYDQDDLRQSLEAHLEQAYPDIETEEGWQTNQKKPTIVVLDPYHPETYKSSKLQ